MLGRVLSFPFIVFLYQNSLSPYFCSDKNLVFLSRSLAYFLSLSGLAKSNERADLTIFMSSYAKKDLLFSLADNFMVFCYAFFVFLFSRVTDLNLFLPNKLRSRLQVRSLTSLTIRLVHEGLMFLPIVLKTRDAPVLLKASESAFENLELFKGESMFFLK